MLGRIVNRIRVFRVVVVSLVMVDSIIMAVDNLVVDGIIVVVQVVAVEETTSSGVIPVCMLEILHMKLIGNS